MALSPSVTSTLKLATSWLVAAAVGIVGIRHVDEISALIGVAVPIAATTEDRTGEREEPPPTVPVSRTSRTVELKASGYGHFHARVYINGRPIDTMVDTGASLVALPYEDARAAGITVRDSDYTHRVNTANGVARVAIVMLDSVAIEDIVVRNVRAAVAEPGKLTKPLLGMTFLGQLRRAEISRGVLTLEE